AALGFVFVTILLDVIGFGLIVPVFPKLLEAFEGGDTARAAEVYGVFAAVWAGVQLFASPLLGALSDRYGRRPVLLLSTLGLGLDYVLMALAPTTAWLLVGRILNGVTAASFSTASAYVADVTPPEKRAAAFGITGAAFGIGFVLGPALGGLLGELGPRVPFWAAAVVALLNFAWGLFVLPESLPPERRAPFDLARANPFGALRLYRENPALLGLAGVFGLYHVAHYVLPSTFVLYAGARFGWGEREVGLTFALVGVTSIVVQAGLVRGAVARLGETGAMLAGLLCGAAGLALYALAPTPGWFLLGVVVYAPAGLFTPGVQSRMTRLVDPRQQGGLQGANGAVMGLSGLVGPIV
ncbi:MAG: MFS transporter, partial [Myxococcota bacterium]